MDLKNFFTNVYPVQGPRAISGRGLLKELFGWAEKVKFHQLSLCGYVGKIMVNPRQVKILVFVFFNDLFFYSLSTHYGLFKARKYF